MAVGIGWVHPGWPSSGVIDWALASSSLEPYRDTGTSWLLEMIAKQFSRTSGFISKSALRRTLPQPFNKCFLRKCLIIHRLVDGLWRFPLGLRQATHLEAFRIAGRVLFSLALYSTFICGIQWCATPTSIFAASSLAVETTLTHSNMALLGSRQNSHFFFLNWEMLIDWSICGHADL